MEEFHKTQSDPSGENKKDVEEIKKEVIMKAYKNKLLLMFLLLLICPALALASYQAVQYRAARQPILKPVNQLFLFWRKGKRLFRSNHLCFGR